MKTEEVRYVGPNDEIALVIPSDDLGQPNDERVVENGNTTVVPMSVAENLVAQETWEYVGDGPPEVGATDGAKELAESEGIDLDNVEGSGADGRVTKADVEAAVEAAGAGANSPAEPGEED